MIDSLIEQSHPGWEDAFVRDSIDRGVIFRGRMSTMVCFPGGSSVGRGQMFRGIRRGRQAPDPTGPTRSVFFVDSLTRLLVPGPPTSSPRRPAAPGPGPAGPGTSRGRRSGWRRASRESPRRGAGRGRSRRTHGPSTDHRPSDRPTSLTPSHSPPPHTVPAAALCRYSWHSAGSLGSPFPMLNI